MANGGVVDYRIFVATTTGHFAVENDAGEVFIHRATWFQTILKSAAIAIWSCRDISDATPAGEIIALDCRSLSLTALDVRGNSVLRSLDCSQNKLTELDLDGLVSLAYLYIRHNPLTDVRFTGCHSLTFIRYSSRQLGRSAFQPARRTPNLVCHNAPIFFAPTEQSPSVLGSPKDALTAAKYVSPWMRPLTLEEAHIRATAYALKEADQEAIAIAAPAMATLIEGPCWLVPIPASDCSIGANLALARAIAGLVPGARVKIAVTRIELVESSTERRRKGKHGLRPHEHRFVRTAGPMNPFPVYFVDNVVTAGNTVRAARAVLGWGTGLAYADASTSFINRVREMVKYLRESSPLANESAGFNSP